MNTLRLAAMAIFAGIAGAAFQSLHDHKAIEQARQAEMQANGLEDQCKAHMEERSAVVGCNQMLTHLPNGGWRLEHVQMPACPDHLLRSVDIPERDEVDALTVNCGVTE